MKRLVVFAAALALAGCQTVFTGAAKVQNGPKGCKDACDAWGMDLAGMVKMGEYSDGCICQVRPGTPGAPRSSADAPATPGGPQAVAGVWVQMQAAAAATAQQSAANRAATQSTYVPSSSSGPHGFYPGRP
jgi:hypothetical protein